MENQLKISGEESSKIFICLYIFYIIKSMAYGLRNFKSAFRNTSPIIPALSRINPIPRIDTYFFKIYFNIVFPSMPSPS